MILIDFGIPSLIFLQNQGSHFRCFRCTRPLDGRADGGRAVSGQNVTRAVDRPNKLPDADGPDRLLTDRG